METRVVGGSNAFNVSGMCRSGFRAEAVQTVHTLSPHSGWFLEVAHTIWISQNSYSYEMKQCPEKLWLWSGTTSDSLKFGVPIPSCALALEPGLGGEKEQKREN